MKNERGSALIIVLLVSLILTTTGLYLLLSTMDSNRHSEIRKKDVQLIQEGYSQMNEILNAFRTQTDALDLSDEKRLTDYNPALNDIIQELSTSYPSLRIEDLTQQLLGIENASQAYFSRVYELKLVVKNEELANLSKTISTRVMLSPTPSFFQFVAGAQNQIELYGGSSFNGDVYGKQIILSHTPSFIKEGASQHIESVLPKIDGDLYLRESIAITEKNRAYIQSFGLPEEKSIYEVRGIDDFLKDGSGSLNLLGTHNLIENAPQIKKNKHRFVEMDLEETFAQKLNQSLKRNSMGLLDKEDVIHYLDENSSSMTNNHILNQVLPPIPVANSNEDALEIINGYNSSLSDFYVIERDTNQKELFQDLGGKNKTILLTDYQNFPKDETLGGEQTYILNKDLNLENNQWLIVNGNLEIASSNEEMTIQGNILVFGDVTFRGDNEVDFKENDSILCESVIYALGKGEIYSTNIQGMDQGGRLILMTKKELDMYRMNEFATLSQQNDSGYSVMDAFLYTDSSAEMYGVGSAFSINGGIFARDQLIIHAIRQNQVQPDFIALPFETQKSQQSRFQVKYDDSILTTVSEQSLPRSKKLQFIIQNYTVK